ncbi:MAG: hypothetical protein ABIQ31_10745, partial [Ferruginibacter sp.]
TGLAAFFGSVPMKSELKKCAAYFFKEAKTAAFRLRSLPAVEAEVESSQVVVEVKIRIIKYSKALTSY